MATSEKYHRWVSQGLCGRCGRRPPREGIKICDECVDYHKKWSAKQWQDPIGKEKRRARLKKWQQENKEYVADRSMKDYYKVKQEALDHYGRKCSCCGTDQEEFLTFDHIDGSGGVERRFYKGNILKSFKRRGYPDHIQILCYNCNMAKYIYGECPHVKNKSG